MIAQQALETGSVTDWLQGLPAGEPDALLGIWKRFYEKVVRLASKELGNQPDRAIDGEDVAQSVFRRVYAGVMSGSYSDIDNRQDLWRLLIVSTHNRVRSHFRAIHAQKRPVFSNGGKDDLHVSMFDELSGPVAKAQFADLVSHLLQKLDQEDPTGELRQIALLKLDEYSAEEIGKIVKRRKSHVLQSIRLIRMLWEVSALP
ncbi:MAG: hypothetical protein RL240_3125 [Planctomycetota bacterium]|jgi:DNA-directed RNA polymerase specialized sigma24 family protein